MDRIDVGKLLARLGIEAVAKGDEFIARCPGHAEKSPSWSINRVTGRHYCFSCSFGGTPATLVIQALGVGNLGWTRAEAWRWMRDQGLLVGDGSLGLAVELYLRADKARGFELPASVQFERWPTLAKRYLETRQIDDGQVKRWGLGYAVDGRLAGRVVFPVRNRAHRLLSYSARTFVGSEVRYLTPAADEHPDPGALFGEAGWASQRRVVVVEGAIKALAVERACADLPPSRGVAVAGVLGATQASDPAVIAKLALFPEVLIFFDNDHAGRRASRDLGTALARHAKVKRAFLAGDAIDDAPRDAVRAAVEAA